MAGVALRRGQYPSARREGDRAAGPSGARGGKPCIPNDCGRGQRALRCPRSRFRSRHRRGGRERRARRCSGGLGWARWLCSLRTPRRRNRGRSRTCLTAATVPFQSSTRPPTRWHRLPPCWRVSRGRGRAGRRVAGLCHKPRRQQYCFRHQHRYEYGGRYHPRRHSPWTPRGQSRRHPRLRAQPGQRHGFRHQYREQYGGRHHSRRKSACRRWCQSRRRSRVCDQYKCQHGFRHQQRDQYGDHHHPRRNCSYWA